VRKLAQISYTSQFADTPEFVVLFLPSDAFFTAALEQEPGLIEEAFQQSVLIATPATLVALLKTVYYGWRQESLTENAQKIAVEARELYNRVRIFSEHIDKVGKGLEDAVRAHNKASSAFASRVLPQGRRVEELGAASEKKPPPARRRPAPRSSRASPQEPTATPPKNPATAAKTAPTSPTTPSRPLSFTGPLLLILEATACGAQRRRRARRSKEAPRPR
jgi:DNA recombination protein RmuC